LSLVYFSSSNKIDKNTTRTFNLAYPPQLLSLISNGHQTTVSFFYWISFINEFSESIFSNNNNIEHQTNYYFDVISNLNRFFKQPYYTLGVLPLKIETEKKISILKRGMEIYPEDWQIALYLSLQFADQNNYSEAHKVIINTLKKSSPPKYLTHLANSYKNEALPKNELLLNYLVEAYNSTEWRKKAICKKLKIRLLLKEQYCLETINNQNYSIQTMYRKLQLEF
jgi:hypothetical protein